MATVNNDVITVNRDDDVEILNVETLPDDSLAVDVLVEADGQTISSDDVIDTIEDDPEAILDGVCTDCTVGAKQIVEISRQ